MLELNFFKSIFEKFGSSRKGLRQSTALVEFDECFFATKSSQRGL
jgi:hypothetical protein